MATLCEAPGSSTTACAATRAHDRGRTGGRKRKVQGAVPLSPSSPSSAPLSPARRLPRPRPAHRPPLCDALRSYNPRRSLPSAAAPSASGPDTTIIMQRVTSLPLAPNCPGVMSKPRMLPCDAAATAARARAATCTAALVWPAAAAINLGGPGRRNQADTRGLRRHHRPLRTLRCCAGLPPRGWLPARGGGGACARWRTSRSVGTPGGAGAGRGVTAGGGGAPAGRWPGAPSRVASVQGSTTATDISGGRRPPRTAAVAAVAATMQRARRPRGPLPQAHRRNPTLPWERASGAAQARATRRARHGSTTCRALSLRKLLEPR